jgi:hypothetical protein
VDLMVLTAVLMEETIQEVARRFLEQTTGSY